VENQYLWLKANKRGRLLNVKRNMQPSKTKQTTKIGDLPEEEVRKAEQW